MELSSKTEGQVRIVTVRNARIDAAGAIEFKDAMRAETDNGPDLVVLDLSAVDFIDSSGLGAIVAAMKHLAPQRKLALAGLTPTVDKVFKLTRMDSVFSLFATLDDARSALAA
ncbi:STAS domain-containing protein [Pseudosulfitobacter sp. DSM 107133]|jgi:anti-sigma B factor antagonist|uniref:STAS domain-containing protein n=1 Tax=Pseudosulfitobacter sp. DSM 107133 TaxID=2883100 RepID=UPI000DF2E473|nr:STAS domain-containing protein [Pseudosulfitobacter sp. DSM 107133]UOA25582.1 Anti-sigma-B factor antagonist [Pseudosulfitobacter sp. DSM 107133]